MHEFFTLARDICVLIIVGFSLAFIFYGLLKVKEQ